MITFWYIVRKHDRWSGKNRKRVFPEADYDRAVAHYGRLVQNSKIDRVFLNLRCGMTQPFDEIVLEEHWK